MDDLMNDDVIESEVRGRLQLTRFSLTLKSFPIDLRVLHIWSHSKCYF